MTQKVVIFTPIEDALMNTNLGASLIMWFACFAAGALLIYSQSDEGRRFKPWQFAALTACVTYTLHCGLIWALGHL